LAADLMVGLVVVLRKGHEAVLPALEGVKFGLIGLPLLDQCRVSPSGKHVRHVCPDSAGQRDLAVAIHIHAVTHAAFLSGCSSAVLGKSMVRIPKAGRKAQIWNTGMMPIQSASPPITAAPSAPM